MPKKSKTKSATSQQIKLATETASLVQTGRTTEADDEYKKKNSRARELILSTLSPGTEPWKIAESLEHASDIWKALEDRYAPKQTEKEENEYIKKQVQGSMLEVDVKTVPNHIPEATRTGSDPIENLGNDERRRKVAQARASKEFYESMPDPNQRLIWALLHGGKPETEAWFNGTVLQT